MSLRIRRRNRSLVCKMALARTVAPKPRNLAPAWLEFLRGTKPAGLARF